jgi:hypothetical protein
MQLATDKMTIEYSLILFISRNLDNLSTYSSGNLITYIFCLTLYGITFKIFNT